MLTHMLKQGSLKFIIWRTLAKVLIQNIQFETKNTESTERRKTSFAREQVENGGLHKPV